MILVAILAIVHAALFAVLFLNVIGMRGSSRPRISAAPMRRLSVLIPARNEADNLRRLLPSLMRQDHPDLEVIVVDDDSSDGSWDVLSAIEDPRFVAIRSDGPPAGWVGKVHALYQASRRATGDTFLFLDADAELKHTGALSSLARRMAASADGAVLTGLTDLRGGGKLLVSLVTHAMLSAVPWFLIRRGFPGFGALNGQCWLIRASDYRRLDPHLHHRNEVLEDVRIGRFLARRGLVPTVVDARGDVAIHMYRDFADAWLGFRKNAYLVMGGTLPRFFLSLASYWSVYLVAPVLSPWFLLSVFLLKGVTDRRTGFPLWVTALAPVSFALGAVLQLDSAAAHWRGGVVWKDRALKKGG